MNVLVAERNRETCKVIILTLIHKSSLTPRPSGSETKEILVIPRISVPGSFIKNSANVIFAYTTNGILAKETGAEVAAYRINIEYYQFYLKNETSVNCFVESNKNDFINLNGFVRDFKLATYALCDIGSRAYLRSFSFLSRFYAPASKNKFSYAELLTLKHISNEEAFTFSLFANSSNMRELNCF